MVARIARTERIVSDGLTSVHLIWVEKQTEHWLRFGTPAGDEIIDRRRRVVHFSAGSIFAFARWSANDYGTVVSRIDVVQAADVGEPFSTIPGIFPGAISLLRISGWPKVAQVLRAIDAVEAQGIAPETVCPDHWRHVHNRLLVGERPRVYAANRHRLWLKRKALQP